MRPARPADVPFLKQMLYEAANRHGDEWPDLETSLNEGRNKRFWFGWGREGDIGVVAEKEGTAVGAAWIRYFDGKDLSPLDDPAVPVLAIGVVHEHRGRGVGGLLMEGLIDAARRSGVAAIALSTGASNEPALRLYRRHGFEEAPGRGDGVRMVAVLAP